MERLGGQQGGIASAGDSQTKRSSSSGGRELPGQSRNRVQRVRSSGAAADARESWIAANTPNPPLPARS